MSDFKKTLKPPQAVPVQQEGGPLSFSRLSREIVMDVFAMMGGKERLAKVAEDDPKWFYEKGFFRLTAPEKTEIRNEVSVADLLLELDRQRDANSINITAYSAEATSQHDSDDN